MTSTVLRTTDTHIVSSPDVRGGKPRIDGSRITVADIALMHLRMGHSPAEIAGRFDLSLAAVHAALAFYYDHRTEIDQAIRDDEATADALRSRGPSPLQRKLVTAR